MMRSTDQGPVFLNPKGCILVKNACCRVIDGRALHHVYQKAPEKSRPNAILFKPQSWYRDVSRIAAPYQSKNPDMTARVLLPTIELSASFQARHNDDRKEGLEPAGGDDFLA